MKNAGGYKVTCTQMSAEEVIRYFLMLFSSHPLTGSESDRKDKIALVSGLGAEDQVLTDMVLSIKPDARIFVLDTGRLHPETCELMSATMSKYHMHYEILFPDPTDVEEIESECGSNRFYESTENRERCCNVREAKPFRRILPTLEAWITGRRTEQTVTRGLIERVEWDEAHGLVRVNPLADWSEEDVWEYIRTHGVPYNKLHDKRYQA